MSEPASNVRAAKPGLAARRMAAHVLKDVLSGESFQPVGADAFDDPRDRALCNRLVTVALRRHGHLNLIIAGLLQKGMPPRSGLFEPLLRLGLTELLFIEGQAAHSAFDLAVEILKRDRRGGRFDRLLNGALRQAQRDADKWLALEPELLVPEWLRHSWTAAFGGGMVAEAAAALLDGPALDLTLKDTPPELVSELGGELVLGNTLRLVDRDRSVVDLPGYAEGRWWVQDAAAAVPARLIDLPEGAKVLDMCAAPGGKTAQLCAAGYQVTALDRDGVRLKRVGENLQRLGFEAELVEGDALKFDPGQKFDAVLIDAPCTATGTLRRHPEVLWHRTPKDIAQLQELQRQMISSAVNLLANDGVLVFCTCSLQPEEGEVQAAWISAQFAELTVLPITPKQVGGFTDSISPQGWFRTHPGLDLPKGGKTDGFFAVTFRRG